MEKPKLIPWYFSKAFVICMLLSIGPLALPLIWFHPNISLKWKIGNTIITLAVTYLLYLLSLLALRKLYEMYQLFYGLNP